MHGEAPPPFDGEEAGLATKTTRKMICTYICMWYIGIMGHPGTVHGDPGHTSSKSELCSTYPPSCIPLHFLHELFNGRGLIEISH